MAKRRWQAYWVRKLARQENTRNRSSYVNCLSFCLTSSDSLLCSFSLCHSPLIFCYSCSPAADTVEGENITIKKVSRLHMGAYLAIGKFTWVLSRGIPVHHQWSPSSSSCLDINNSLQWCSSFCLKENPSQRPLWGFVPFSMLVQRWSCHRLILRKRFLFCFLCVCLVYRLTCCPPNSSSHDMGSEPIDWSRSHEWRSLDM